MGYNKLIARWSTPAAFIVFCAGCTVSVHAGYGNPQAEQVYVAAISRPMNALTAASSRANQTCAGGSKPDPARCYSNTKIEIEAARALQRAMRSVPTPPRFAKANRDLLQGLDLFIKGLTKRNEGIAAHSASEYTTGSNLITKGLALQRAALAEYPADAHIAA